MTAVTSLAAAVLLAGALAVAMRFGMRWGATAEELSTPIAGDEWLDGGPAVRVRMTRAITIAAPPSAVWPWLTQLGRGAGWYSYDRLDNGGKRSARRLVSWIPGPEIGDAAPIGYLRALVPGVETAWWFDGRFAGAACRAVYAYRLRPAGEATRLILRVSADGAGWTAPFAAWVLLPLIDSIMARRQLIGLREAVESFVGPSAVGESPETGARDQYQLYQVIYAAGAEAGAPGRTDARSGRQAAIRDGVLPREAVPGGSSAGLAAPGRPTR